MALSDKQFYTIQEFADFLGMHYNTIYRWIKRGHIQAFRVGRGKNCEYRIAKSEIERMGLFNLDEVLGKMIDDKLRKKEITDR